MTKDDYVQTSHFAALPCVANCHCLAWLDIRLVKCVYNMLLVIQEAGHFN